MNKLFSIFTSGILVVSCSFPTVDARESPQPTSTVSASPTPFSTLEKQTTLTINNHLLSVEVALTPAEQSQGLMFREKMDENHGMLFVFQPVRSVKFWMKNTLLPLTIAFINNTNTIVDIQDMSPQSETLHPSSGNVRYALEVNQGWFRKYDIKVGDKVVIDGEEQWLSKSLKSQ